MKMAPKCAFCVQNSNWFRLSHSSLICYSPEIHFRPVISIALLSCHVMNRRIITKTTAKKHTAPHKKWVNIGSTVARRIRADKFCHGVFVQLPRATKAYLHVQLRIFGACKTNLERKSDFSHTLAFLR